MISTGGSAEAAGRNSDTQFPISAAWLRGAAVPPRFFTGPSWRLRCSRNLIANMLSFKQREYFEIEDAAARQPVAVRS
jgi:hypothetical protein